MMWFFSILVVLAMGGVAAVAVGRGEPMAEEHPDRPDVLVPGSGPLSGTDLRTVRFPMVFRGYRMADVDALLDRLAGELGEESLKPPVEPEATSETSAESTPEASAEPTPQADPRP